MSETMEETMKREQAEALATLMKANRALDRIFGIQEEENEVRCNMCMSIYEANVTTCSKCLTNDYLMSVGGGE